jgi:site-specific DNA-methyltransferase (adenine-specific)
MGQRLSYCCRLLAVGTLHQGVRVNKVVQGDCLDVMASLPPAAFDMVLCDLPYGTTACAWDEVIPFQPLWDAWRRLLKPDSAIVLTASQPFTSRLVASNLRAFKYQWVWIKPRPSNPQLAKKQPLKFHEDVLVFCEGRVPYFPQGLREIPVEEQKLHSPESNSLGHCRRKPYVQTHTGYPRSLLEFPAERGLHPTQKPVSLMEYLVRTYTKTGAQVLDSTCGSGSTGVGAIKAGRSFVGIEKDPKYAALAAKRIADAEAAALTELFA